MQFTPTLMWPGIALEDNLTTIHFWYRADEGVAFRICDGDNFESAADPITPIIDAPICSACIDCYAGDGAPGAGMLYTRFNSPTSGA
ncbi:MAG: hypothetical protein HQ478_12715 [Chloroflexi bacterium]|nr:hypothetical protein [Chloroflexota bacterium]